MTPQAKVRTVQRKTHADVSDLRNELRTNNAIQIVLANGLTIPVNRFLRKGLQGLLNSQSSEEVFLKPAAAAELIGVSRPTVLKLIKNGVLTAEYVPGSKTHRRIKKSLVQEYLETHSRLMTGLNASLASAPKTKTVKKKWAEVN
jgi:excisionase family DNA binding protein